MSNLLLAAPTFYILVFHFHSVQACKEQKVSLLFQGKEAVRDLKILENSIQPMSFYFQGRDAPWKSLLQGPCAALSEPAWASPVCGLNILK